MCNFLSTLRLGVSPSFFNKKSDEFGQLFNAELLKQKKEDETVLSLHLHQDHAEDPNLPCSSVMQVSNVQSGNPTVVPGSHEVCSPTFQTCETASTTLLGALSSTQLTPSNATNPAVVDGNNVVTGGMFHTCPKCTCLSLTVSKLHFNLLCFDNKHIKYTNILLGQ